MSKHVERDPNALYCDDPSLTVQSFSEECDINGIIARASKGVVPTHINSRAPMYADVTNVPDYRSAFDIVKRANDLFMGLDAFVRERFANDPARMMAFLSDPKNRAEAISLGLVEAPPQVEVSGSVNPNSGDSSPIPDSGDTPDQKPVKAGKKG